MTAKTVLIVDDSRVARMVVIGLTGKIRPDWSLREAASELLSKVGDADFRRRVRSAFLRP